MMFTDANPNLDTGSKPIDFTFIGICAIYLIVHLSFLTVGLFTQSKANLRKRTQDFYDKEAKKI